MWVAIVLSTVKAMREAPSQDKTDIVPTPLLFIITALPEGTGEHRSKINMDKRTATFIEQVTNRFSQFNIVHQVMESDYKSSNTDMDEPFACDYRISIWLQNNKLGHQDLYMYLNKEDDLSLVAVKTTHTTPKLLEICQQLGMLYGVPFKTIMKDKIGRDNYYFIF